jgi:BNR repeat-like domain
MAHSTSFGRRSVDLGAMGAVPAVCAGRHGRITSPVRSERRSVSQRASRRAAASAVMLAVVLVLGSTARAATTVVSGPSPYSQCSVPRPPHDRVAVNAEVEPWVGVDPLNESHVVAVWQQDRFRFGGANGLVAGVSLDGGATWTESTLPFGMCSGGLDFERASDPWISIGPDGIVYASALVVDLINDRDNGVAVAVSRDGGMTWDEPVLVHANTGRTAARAFDDKESITADPTRPGVAYLVWDRGVADEDEQDHGAVERVALRASDRPPPSAPVWFATTDDGGATWSDARPILDPRPGRFTIGNQIVVDPTTGTLYDVFDYFVAARRSFYEALLRSEDGGATWSRPIRIARDLGIGVEDPNTGTPLRVGTGLPDVAVDPSTGTVYVVWEDARFSRGRHDDIALSFSTDGGQTWSEPTQANPRTGRPAFTPSVEVRTDGTVGVTYYDLRFLERQKHVLPTAYWLAEFEPDGTRISETQLAGPFDDMFAPRAGGLFLGDYQGLAVSNDRFLSVFIVANNDTSDRTQVVASIHA